MVVACSLSELKPKLSFPGVWYLRTSGGRGLNQPRTPRKGQFCKFKYVLCTIARWRHSTTLGSSPIRRRCARMLPESTDGGASCACKGIRRCLICEKLKGKVPLGGNDAKVKLIIVHLHFTKNILQYIVVETEHK